MRTKPIITIAGVFIFLFLIGFIVAGLFAFNLFSIAPLDDYITAYDAKTRVIPDNTIITNTDNINLYFKDGGESLIMYKPVGNDRIRYSIKWNKDLKGLYSKVEIRNSPASQGGYPYNYNYQILEVNLNNINIYSDVDTGTFGNRNVENIVIEIKPKLNNPNDITEYDVYIRGKYIKTISISDNNIYMVFTSGTLGINERTVVQPENGINYLKYKVPFESCTVLDGEVIVREDFEEGTNININSFKYPVKRFCINNPPQLLKLGVGQEAETRGDLFTELVSGDDISVASGFIYKISYVTNYQQGMEQNCPVGSAVINAKTGQCEQYAIEQAPETVILPPSLDFLNVGNNVFVLTFSNNGDLTSNNKISDEVFTVRPKWICENDYDRYNDDSCYQYTLKGDLKDFDKQYSYNTYLKYECSKTSVFIDPNDEDWDIGDVYTISCKFTLDSGFLDLMINEDPTPDKGYFDLNEPINLNIGIKNNLFRFDESGWEIDYYVLSGIQRDIEPVLETKSFIKGQQQHTLKLKNDEVGQFFVTLAPYIELQGKNILLNSKITYNYIVGKSIYEVSGGTTEKPKVNEKEDNNNFPANLLIIGGAITVIVFILLIISVAIYFIRK